MFPVNEIVARLLERLQNDIEPWFYPDHIQISEETWVKLIEKLNWIVNWIWIKTIKRAIRLWSLVSLLIESIVFTTLTIG